ncbi:hypothetical protein P5673_032707 [Acropora cervicornis]|uniref:Uncharacterized protein n=1 Tax=Acropora cervicornis TaxID=6130 RepID=A0AAD9PQV9_ACRCE|nr:hypothetical protein P5673_032707 [Acropora cervicornis]
MGWSGRCRMYFLERLSLVATNTPIFCTGKQPLIYVKNGVIDQREIEMMSVRWKIFQFNLQIEQNDQKEIPQCARCFASLVLN